jgi:hypothetical protein
MQINISIDLLGKSELRSKKSNIIDGENELPPPTQDNPMLPTTDDIHSMPMYIDSNGLQSKKPLYKMKDVIKVNTPIETQLNERITKKNG